MGFCNFFAPCVSSKRIRATKTSGKRLWIITGECYYIFETPHSSETHSACWISWWALSSPSWQSFSPQFRRRWPRGIPQAGLCCRWCRGSSWCIALLSFYSSPFADDNKDTGQKSCWWFMLRWYLRNDCCHPQRAAASLRWSAYLWTVKVCCQHNDRVGQDVCGVSAGKEGLPGKLKGRGGNRKQRILIAASCMWVTLNQIQLFPQRGFSSQEM